MQSTVHSDDIRNASSHVRAGAAEVADVLQKLTAQISSLAWQGDAYNAFHEHWTRWQAGADQIHQAMDDMGIFLDQAATHYETTEANIASAARA